MQDHPDGLLPPGSPRCRKPSPEHSQREPVSARSDRRGRKAERSPRYHASTSSIARRNSVEVGSATGCGHRLQFGEEGRAVPIVCVEYHDDCVDARSPEHIRAAGAATGPAECAGTDRTQATGAPECGRCRDRDAVAKYEVRQMVRSIWGQDAQAGRWPELSSVRISRCMATSGRGSRCTKGRPTADPRRPCSGRPRFPTRGGCKKSRQIPFRVSRLPEVRVHRRNKADAS